MQGLAWWNWAVVSALVAVAELHLPGSYLIWVALGGMLTAVAAAAGQAASLEMQISVFAVAAGLSCVAGWFVYHARPWHKGEDALLNRRAQQMVGARATVCDGFVNGEGKVRLGDSEWLAEGVGLSAGSTVVVTEVRGARLVVRAADGQPSPQ